MGEKGKPINESVSVLADGVPGILLVNGLACVRKAG